MLLAKFLFEGDATKSGAWNFGPEEDEVKEVEAIVSLFIKIFGKGSYTVREDKTKHEDEVLRLNIDKAQRQLDWKPKFSVKEVIEKTASWYKAFYTKSSDMRQYTVRQIRNYFER
jgi:CDP-glucose 4,6-dehydratase